MLFTWAEALSVILHSLSAQFLTGIEMKPVLQIKKDLIQPCLL